MLGTLPEDRLRAVFLPGMCEADKIIRLTSKIPGTILDRADWIASAWRCRARGTPGEEPAPLCRGFC
jgi:hypothetical protein